ncbi:HAMP domain-containing histidine kinase [candidate division WWE3 bacterium]|nr:HAMP domain-containing histidine kinase [candidate division WWE3 bacterium]
MDATAQQTMPASKTPVSSAALRDLKKSNKLKDEFIAITVHNQKTPLIIIQGYVDLVQKETKNLSDMQKHALEEIEKQSKRLIEINSRLLSVTKLHGDVIALKKETVDLAELTRDVAASFVVKLQNKRIRLVIDTPEQLTAKIDCEWIREVWENLLSNALKFTPEGGKITISVKPKGQTIMCQITDTGIGIDKQEIQNIFAPFYRTQDALTGGYDGIGLGLYIVKLIIKGHNGKIRIVPSHKGARIQFLLPKN